MEHSLTLLTDIALGIIFAAAASHVARLFRQPLILGYVLGGVLLGTQLGFGLIRGAEEVELISEIGLILLLFIIGLEINLGELIRLGRPVFILGATQFIGCVALGLAFFYALGYRNGGGNFDLLYIAVALALSSTLIVVKLLTDKFETRTMAGRVTIGILVLQDLWAILFMAFQPNLLSPELGGILRSFGQGIVLVLVAFLASRYLLQHLFQAAAKTPELVLLSSIAWCFLLCGLAEKAGLSKEMGALIAGISIGSFPYGTYVVTKLSGVRDFFVTLFFVSLGLKVPMPTLAVVGLSALMILFVFVSRVLSVAALSPAVGIGMRNGFVTSVNLAQISEFSLVILALGAGYRHISPELQSLLLTAMLAASIVSTYLIYFNDSLARLGVRFAQALGVREKEMHGSGVTHEHGRDIVLLGCYRGGRALLEMISQRRPDLRSRILVVDYTPVLKEKLEAEGYGWVYGDLAFPESLHHAGVSEATVIICSVSDTFLKGTTNLRLLSQLKQLAPSAQLVMTADYPQQADALREGGAIDAVVPGQLAGNYFYEVLLRSVDAR